LAAGTSCRLQIQKPAINCDYSAKQRYLPKIRLHEFPVAFGHCGAIVLISTLFPVGSTEVEQRLCRLLAKPFMKFRHLEYFVAAAEELNFTHAADRLHVSQPPFSKQIHDLEGELGIDLFERHRKGVAVTPRPANRFWLMPG
jgi:hypothetical protein